MKKLSKAQKMILERALDKLYTFLKEKFNVEYDGSVLFIVYDDIVRLQQCSIQNRVAWFTDISLKERKIYIITREVERELICSLPGYSLYYMGAEPRTFNLDF